MSTIICLKEAGRLALGTDSRFMNNDFSGVESDSIPKITRINETDAFIATTGWSTGCEFHTEAACEIAARLGTDDIRVLADALDRASPRFLEALVATLAQRDYSVWSRTVAGACPLQGFLLAGRGAGSLGFVYVEYWHHGGQLRRKMVEYFGAERFVQATGAPDDFAPRLFRDPVLWKAPVVDVVRRWLTELRKVNPYVGGSDQILLIDVEGGPRWISEPPKAEPPAAQLAHATITAAISIAAPTLTGTTSIEGGSLIALPPAGTGVFPRVHITSSGVYCYSAAAAPTIQLIPDLSVALSVPLYMGGQQVIGNRGAAVANASGGAVVDSECRAALNDLLSRLRASTGHGLIGG